MRSALIAAVIATAAVGGCGGLAHLAAGKPQWRKRGPSPATYGLTAERVTMRSSDKLRVAGWWFAAADPHATVVLAHGIGGSKADMLPQTQFLVEAGYDVLAIDLRAHGESEGTYPTGGYREQAEVRAAIDYAARRSPRPIVLLGHSMGGVAVLHAAAHHDPDVVAVVADSAFVTFYDMARRARAKMTDLGLGARIGMAIALAPTWSGVVRFVMWCATGADLDPAADDLIPVLPRLKMPVLFVSGDRDDLAPTRNAKNMRRLVGRLGEIAVLHASHQTYKDAPAAYHEAVLGFLARVIAAAPVVARSMK